MTPLRYAWWIFTDDSTQGMKALLENGAQADQTINGITLLNRSVDNPGEEYLEMSRVLLEGGANPNVVEKDTKETPIFSAIYGNQFESVKLLHQFGADLDFKNKCDKTPFQFAVQTRQFDIAFWLEEQGVDVQNMNKYGGTPARTIHDSLTENLYNDWAKEAGLKMKALLEKKGVEFPPLSPEENRKKFNMSGDC
jgi:ankyrin repeat protein